MKTLFATVFLASLLLISKASSGCLCTYGQPCWPSAATFSQLQSQLSRPLVYPHPTAYPCYPPSHPSGNCTNVSSNWKNPNWRASQPGSLEIPNWEAYTSPNGSIEVCFLNTNITGTCEQGRVPVIGVDARSVGDVQTAVGFAVKHNLKLVVKNTGHDYIGRSTARGAFVVWIHNMKTIKYDDVFVPQGAPGNETFEAVKLDAGVQWHEAYAAVNDHKRLMVGSVDAGGSVGASGGWLMGGGHSFLSPTYGLGVDNVLEISVVLSTGHYLIANKYLHSDLFWAMRGGGGGTYGIVTSVTYRTYPVVPFQVWTYQANVTNSSVLPELVEGYLRYQTQFTDKGWGGYGGVFNQGFSFAYFAPNMSNETVTTTTQPWMNFVQSLKPYGVMSTSQLSSSSWMDVLEQATITAPGGGEYELLTSRLLSRDTVASNSSKVAQVLIACEAGFNTVAGGKVSQFGADSAGLNPAWRNAVVETECAISWDENTPYKDIQNMIEQLRGWVHKMYDATPHDGAYLNEASPFEVQWKKTFFGSHYSKLKSIKDKYDPYRLFVVSDGVGSEEWNKELTCRGP